MSLESWQIKTAVEGALRERQAAHDAGQGIGFLLIIFGPWIPILLPAAYSIFPFFMLGAGLIHPLFGYIFAIFGFMLTLSMNVVVLGLLSPLIVIAYGATLGGIAGAVLALGVFSIKDKVWAVFIIIAASSIGGLWLYNIRRLITVLLGKAPEEIMKWICIGSALFMFMIIFLNTGIAGEFIVFSILCYLIGYLLFRLDDRRNMSLVGRIRTQPLWIWAFNVMAILEISLSVAAFFVRTPSNMMFAVAFCGIFLFFTAVWAVFAAKTRPLERVIT